MARRHRSSSCVFLEGFVLCHLDLRILVSLLRRARASYVPILILWRIVEYISANHLRLP